MAAPRRIGLALEVHLLYKWHSELFAGVQRFAEEQEWETLIDDYVHHTVVHPDHIRRPYDGVIARVDDSRIGLVDLHARRGVPVVNVLQSSPAYDRLPGVYADMFQIGQLRAEHLLSRGLRRFGYLAIDMNPAVQLQLEGFIATIQQEGYDVAQLEVPDDREDTLAIYEMMIGAIDRWMLDSGTPIGVGLSADTHARELIQACREHGLRVPEDVAIVGGMNEEKLCEHPRPSLTSIECGWERVGYEAARMLHRLMDGAGQQRTIKNTKAQPRIRKVSQTQILVPPVGVVVRESTDFFAVDNEMVAAALAYIANKSHLALTVSDVSEAMGVSNKTLQNRFNDSLGRPVAREIRRVRVEKAKRELSGSDGRIAEIAARTGFITQKRMYEAFKSEVGMTPSAYRKQSRLTASGRSDALAEQAESA